MTAALPVACRGFSPGYAAVWWQSEGWNVTAYGLEQSDGHNAISADRLADLNASGGLRWISAMDDAGVDLDLFLPAYAVALALHGHAGVDPALIPASANAYRKSLRRAAYEAAVEANRKKAAAAQHAKRRGMPRL